MAQQSKILIIMAALKKLSEKDLNKLIDQAAKELEQRKRLQSISRDVNRLLAKHKVTKAELALVTAMIRGELKSQKARPSKASKRVAPKYRSESGSDTWTGRGVAPKWVVAACEKDNISIQEFKQSDAYFIK